MNGRDPKDGPGTAAGSGADAGPGWVRFEPPLVLQGGDLGAFIRHHLPSARAVGVEYLESGVVNSNYRVELEWPAQSAATERPRTVRLRLSRSDEGPLREGALGESLDSRLPTRVPRLLATGRGEAPEPHRRSLFTWIEGEPLGERGAWLAEAGGALAAELGQTLAALHAEALPAFGRLDAQGRPSGVLLRWPDEVTRMVGVRLENPAHGLSPRRIESVRLRFARRLAPLREGPVIPASLVHGDLSPGNVIVTPGPPASTDGPGLAGLVDWEMARSADGALDLASLRFEWRGALAPLARRVEQAYQAARAAEGGEACLYDWERRVALATVPRLLDARMVARRRVARGALDEIDQLLDDALGDTGGAA